MSNDWVPKNFGEIAGKAGHWGVEQAASDLLEDVDKTFKPLGVQAGIEKRQVMKKVTSEEMCPRCNKALSGRVLVAMEQKYHIECFVCSQCDRPIEDGFTVRKGQPWCQKCIDWSTEKPIGGPNAEANAKKAAKAGKDMPVGINDEAKSPAGAEAMDTDIDAMRGFDAKICAKCNNKIIVGLDYDGASYCAECFTCARCKTPIDVTKGFLPQGSKVYCSHCAHAATGAGGPTTEQAGSNCYACAKLIDGKYVKVDGKAFHKDCFKCSSCKTSLANGFATKGKKMFCPECAKANGDVTAEVVPLEKPINGLVLNSYDATVTENKPQHTLLKDKEPIKFCFNCGFNCEGKKFCPGCGTKLQ